MARSTTARIYNHKDSHLLQVADGFCNMAARDAVELLDFGFTATDLAAIRAARNAFMGFPEDIEFSAPYIINTELRDSLYNSLTLALRQISTRAQFAYGIHSSTYRLFALGNLSKYTDERLIRATTHICTLATTHLPQLAPQGLTAPIIATALATASQLSTCLDDRFTIALTRESATLHRIELGNALYALLTTLSEKGKLCFRDSSNAKYHHYQITE